MIGFSYVKNLGTSEVLAKAAGLTTLALVAVDCHHAAKEKAAMIEKNEKASNLAGHYMEDMKLDSPSIVKSKLKSAIFKLHLDENITGFFANIKGYFQGFGSMMLDGIIPLGLATGAIVSKNALLSKTFGLGLLAYGSIFLLQEGFGIGKSHEKI